eukprot:COSAG06_NODE_46373_length_347_cov_1.024194_1_plen_67_part_01
MGARSWRRRGEDVTITLTTLVTVVEEEACRAWLAVEKEVVAAAARVEAKAAAHAQLADVAGVDIEGL